MDIAALSMNMAQQNVMNTVGVAMLDKTMDTAAAIGSGINDMIASAPAPALERSVTPHIGGNFDMSV